MPRPDLAQLVAELEEEQASLQAVLAEIEPDQWLVPTPAEGWDVRDTVSHLADTDEIAVDTVLGGPRSLNDEAARFDAPEAFTLSACLKGRSMTGAEVLAWWERASQRERDVLLAADPSARVPWGLGMLVPSLVTARVMETWAHGLDIRAALGAPDHDTDTNLSHVAWIGTRALPYAFSVAGREMPPGDLRVELDLPSGAIWSHGPPEAADRITGPAAEYCRLFVQRITRASATGLKAEGDLADVALEVARAYL